MNPRLIAITIALLTSVGTPAFAQTEKPAAPKAPVQKPAEVKSIITVTVPTADSALKIQGKLTKTLGLKREFDTPALEAGKFYEYTFELKFSPNNYTTLTRTRTVTFKIGDPVNVDMSKDSPDDKAVIRYVPTPDDVVLQMLKLAKVGKDDVVFDLGCGDARMVIAAVKESGAKKGVGIDIDPERIVESKANVAKEKVEKKVEILQGDLLDDKVLAKVAEATVVMVYLGDEFNNLLKPKLLKVLKPGTRIVSHRFKMGDWKPDQSITVTGEDGDDYELHVWTVPKPK
ncbi:MAG: TIGR03000 domain-containing protein [Gemmataceae bacterium]